jgi:hypothetical protein
MPPALVLVVDQAVQHAVAVADLADDLAHRLDRRHEALAAAIALEADDHRVQVLRERGDVVERHRAGVDHAREVGRVRNPDLRALLEHRLVG